MEAISGWSRTPISTFFTQSDLLIDSRALGRDIDNSIEDERILLEAQRSARELDKLCWKFGETVSVRSWYRCEKLERFVSYDKFESWCTVRNLEPNDESWNTFFLLCSHRTGSSIDFIVVGKTVREVFEYIKHNLTFDQLIIVPEPSGDYIHLSFDARNRKLCSGEIS